MCRCVIGGSNVGRSAVLSGRSERRVVVMGVVVSVVWSWCCMCGGIVMLRVVTVSVAGGGDSGRNGCGAQVGFVCRV